MCQMAHGFEKHFPACLDVYLISFEERFPDAGFSGASVAHDEDRMTHIEQFLKEGGGGGGRVGGRRGIGIKGQLNTTTLFCVVRQKQSCIIIFP